VFAPVPLLPARTRTGSHPAHGDRPAPATRKPVWRDTDYRK